MKSLNLKKTACGLLILVNTQQYAENNKPIEKIKESTLHLIDTGKEAEASDALKQKLTNLSTKTDASFAELEQWCLQFLDLKNTESKDMHLERFTAKKKEIDAVIEQINVLLQDTSMSKKAAMLLAKVRPILQGFNQALDDIYKTLKNYNNSTDRTTLLNLAITLSKYQHLFPQKIRSYSPYQFGTALTHRFECSKNKN